MKKRRPTFRLGSGYQFNRLAVVLVLVIMVAVGVLLVRSRAAQPAAAINSNTGTTAGNVTTVSDATATGGVALDFGPTAAQPGLPIRGVFYYPWFPGAWNQQGLNPFTHYHPTLGFYDSTDPNVINTHINAMIYAGFNTAIFSWWGQGSTEDSRFQSFLTASAGKKLKWAPYYECEGNSSGGACTTLSPSVAQITSDLNYIKTKYTSDPSYLRINNKPVIFVYGDGTDSCTTASNWKSANANVGNSFYVILKVFAGYTSCAAQPDNWHQYGPAVAEDHQVGHSFAISPGFFKANESTPRLARDPNRWVTNITDLKNSNEPLELVTTFNEWGEGSSVESASEWASVSGFGSYIDALHAQLGSTTSDNPPTVTLTGPANGATITGPTPLQAAASDDRGVAKVDFFVDNTLIFSDTTAPYETSWTPTAADNGTHTIRAVATDSAGQTAQSSVSVTVNVTASCSANPSAPTNLAATLASQTSTTVNLSWTASTPAANCTINHYVITRAANGSSTSLNTSTSATNFSDSTTAPATAYTYSVQAVDNANHISAVSNSVTITTPASSCAAAPAAPANFTASLAASNSKTVNTSWSAVTPPANCTITGYNLYRNGAKIQTLSASTTSFADTTTNFNTTYTYSVTATDNSNGSNESAQSASKQVTTPNQADTQAPDVPSGVAVHIVTPTQVTVSWNASADNPKTGGAAGTAGYKLFRDGTLVNGTITTTSANDSFTFAPNQSYSWTVEAYDAANPPNVSAQSAAVSATPNPQVTSGGPCALTTAKPKYNKVIWIWGENTGYGTLAGMKFLNGLAQQCGTDPNYLDNMFGGNDQVSEPHYIAATGGSNCNTGLTPLSGSTGCRTGDSDPPAAGTNSISSIFEQINHTTSPKLSWKAYEEAMPKNCSAGSSGDYAAKHNPPIFFQHLISDGSCGNFDISIPNLKCTSTGCGTPTGALVTDIQNGTLPNFSFVTPGLCNDMHGDSCGGNSAIFDQWLSTYVNLIINGPDYKRGDTAIFVGWDESSPNAAQPNVIIAPSINKSKPTTTINHFALLRTTEQMLGLPGLDGCASGQTPGNVGTCPAGSTVDLRALFNF